MNRRTAFALGVGTVPAAVAVAAGVVVLVDELDPGLRISCGRCAFDTGPMDRTPKLVARYRWQRHRLWHRTRHWRRTCHACAQPLNTPGCMRDPSTGRAGHSVASGVGAGR